MAAIFRKTDREYFVISPIGYISPYSYATKNAKELKRAKIVYRVCFAIASILFLWHYRTFNNVSHPMKWPYLLAIFVGVHVVIYAALAAFFNKIEIFDPNEHGIIIDK